MSPGPGEPVAIYRARDLAEAHDLRLALAGEGVVAHIDNEVSDAGVELLSGRLGPRVFVGAADETAARVIVEKYIHRTTANPRDDDGFQRCLACRALMGRANACPACGWTYHTDPDEAPDPDLNAPAAPDDEPAPAQKPSGRSGPPVLSRRTVWAEVAAVFAVGVVPHLSGAGYMIFHPTLPPPVWLDALNQMVSSGCTIVVVLYVIYRSGEPWARFGLPRPRFSDMFIGLGLLLLAEALWLFCLRRIPTDEPWVSNPFARPHLPSEYLLLMLMYAAGGFAEELVCRAYLVTRFEQLLRSRGAAVLVAAVLFAAYHAYQGPVGVADQLAFGVAYGVAFLALRRVWPLAIGHALYNIRLELAG